MNSTLLNEFLTHINENSLIKPEAKALLAVSGGKDSMCMLDLFLKSKVCVFGIAHCNFQLRGEESNKDEIFVKQFADNQEISLHSVQFETKEFAKKKQLSTQLAARQLRYDWFEKIRQEFGYDFIVTAHHFNDVIETILLNITKGTGLAGLHGIQDLNGNILRPMLFATREKIDNYVAENNILWREDASNATNDYQRNLLRNEVIPLLKQINPNLEETFKRNVFRWKSAERTLQKNDDLLTIEGTDSTKISIESITEFYVLEEYLKQFGFNFSQVLDIFKSLSGHSGKVFSSATHTILKDRNDLVLCEIQKFDDDVFLLEDKGQVLDYQGVELHFFKRKLLKEFNRSLQILDYGKLKFPLILRAWKQGDWFIPLGMKGKKKISDFLIDKKFPQFEKNKILVLQSGDDIVCIIGHRIDERFKVTENTRIFYEILLKN